MCVNHILFIHLFIDGHLVCFHLLAIVSNAALHTDICLSPCFHFPWIYTQEWNCWIIWLFYFQFFKEPPYCSPQWLHKFTFPPRVYQGSLFSTTSPALVIYRLFDGGHSDRCEVISHCGFDLHFSDVNDVEHLFLCLWPSVCLPWKNFYSHLLLIFNHFLFVCLY